MVNNAPRIAKTIANLELVAINDVTSSVQTTSDQRDFLKDIFNKELISSDKLAKEFSSRFGYPLVDVSSINLDSLPREFIDMNVVERHLVLPIYKHGKKLFVAMIDPTNKAALDEIKFYSGLEIVPVQTELHFLDSLIAVSYTHLTLPTTSRV